MTKLQDFLNSKLADVAGLGRNPKAGDLFGIELECEGKNVGYRGDDNDLMRSWLAHHDGSLRNYQGQHPPCEWAFNGPASYKQSVARVNQLFDYFNKTKAYLVCSNRTSTHIHYNMGDKNAYQLVNVFILFTIFEDLLDRYCGEDRRGNLFCLSSRHAEQQVAWIQDACFKNYGFQFREDWRYCSLNVASIHKFCSVEFRGMRGLDKREDVLAWLDIVNEFCEYACYKMHNPVQMIEDLSIKGPDAFVRQVFSARNADRLTAGLTNYEIGASLTEGMRLVQMLCYRIGTEFDQVRLNGKDFWASFNKDPKPVLDVDPDNAGGGFPMKFAEAGRRINLFRQGLERIEPADGPVARAGAVPPDWAQLRNAADFRREAELVEARARNQRRAEEIQRADQGRDPIDALLNRPKAKKARLEMNNDPFNEGGDLDF